MLVSHQLSFLASSLNASEPGIPGISAVIKYRSLRAQLASAAGAPFPEPSVLFIDLPLGQKPFKRSLRGSDAISETSSVSHIEDLEKVEQLSGGQEASEANSPERHPGAPAPLEAEPPGALQDGAQGLQDDRPQVEEPESLR